MDIIKLFSLGIIIILLFVVISRVNNINKSLDLVIANNISKIEEKSGNVSKIEKITCDNAHLYLEEKDFVEYLYRSADYINKSSKGGKSMNKDIYRCKLDSNVICTITDYGNFEQNLTEYACGRKVNKEILKRAIEENKLTENLKQEFEEILKTS